MADRSMKMHKENIDPVEIAKFSELADKWWDPSGKFAALHHINPTRLRYIDQRATLAGKQALDVGCGGGILTEAMAQANAKVIGIDASLQSLSVARQHLAVSRLQIEYHLTSAEAFAKVAQNQFDVVTCMELVEHVPNPSSLVRACSRLVRPGGDLFFATVNRTLMAWLLVILASENLLGIVSKGTHQYKKLVRPQQLTTYAEAAGMQKRDLSGLRYLPFFNYSGLCRSTQMNYLMHFQKPISP